MTRRRPAWFALVAILFCAGLPAGLSAGPGAVLVQTEDYGPPMVAYARVDRPDGTYRRMLTQPETLVALAEDGVLPDGTRLFMETYYTPGRVGTVFHAMKVDGRWQYGSFPASRPDLSVRPQASCLSCHAGAAETDFVFTLPSLEGRCTGRRGEPVRLRPRRTSAVRPAGLSDGCGVLRPAAGDAYPLPLKILHWGIAVLVVGQCLLVGLNAIAYESRPAMAELAVQAHLSIGSLIFSLTVLRLVLRLTFAAPAPPAGKPVWAAVMASLLHALFYGCLLILPLTGYLRLAAIGFEIRLFSVVSLPSLGVDPALARFAATVHGWAAIVLALGLVVHVVAALFHRRLFGAAVLPRMGIGRTAGCGLPRQP